MEPKESQLLLEDDDGIVAIQEGTMDSEDSGELETAGEDVSINEAVTETGTRKR